MNRKNMQIQPKLSRSFSLMAVDDKCDLADRLREDVTEVNMVSRGGVDVIIGNLLLFRLDWV